MTKDLLKFEIIETVVSVQMELAFSLGDANRGEFKCFEGKAKSIKKRLNRIIALMQEYRKEQSNE